MTAAEKVWIAVGFAGQAFFFMRFLVQWIVSERRGESVVPLSFWFFSIGGGIVLLTYAIYRRDPVFIAGQATGLLIYTRNLMLLRAQAHRARAEVERDLAGGGDGRSPETGPEYQAPVRPAGHQAGRAPGEVR